MTITHDAWEHTMQAPPAPMNPLATPTGDCAIYP